MNPLVRYFLHQAGRGTDNGMGPVYALPLFHQRGYGIGSYLGGLWQMVTPIIWRGAKTVGRETLRTGRKILSDIAENDSSDVKPRYFVSKHARNLIGKIRGRCRKRQAKKTTVKKLAVKKPNLTKGDIFP